MTNSIIQELLPPKYYNLNLYSLEIFRTYEFSFNTHLLFYYDICSIWIVWEFKLKGQELNFGAKLLISYLSTLLNYNPSEHVSDLFSTRSMCQDIFDVADELPVWPSFTNQVNEFVLYC